MYGSGQQVKPRLAEHILYTADKLQNGQPSIYRLYIREEIDLPIACLQGEALGCLKTVMGNMGKYFYLWDSHQWDGELHLGRGMER